MTPFFTLDTAKDAGVTGNNHEVLLVEHGRVSCIDMLFMH